MIDSFILFYEENDTLLQHYDFKMMSTLIDVCDDDSFLLSIMEVLEDKILGYLLYTKTATKLYIECV